ncbi:unnamed protein product [Echinostoma caproni]|uniref:PLAT domain-containing protein n=1 Tax=Echinostoma caproni TaxID=27848 RepID=A0A183AUH8_9TREM|nr:unnamed protein product [Echinostoma caproni]
MLFVTFKVAEKRFTTARISVTHGTDGTNKICGNIRLNNVLRRAESVDLDMEIGTNQLTSKCAAVSKPLENNPFVRFTFGGTEGHFDHWWAKFLRHERSVFTEIQALSAIGLHKFQWDAAWREVEAKDATAPWNVRRESGSALKVSLRHIFERDSRSDHVFPDDGMLFRLSNELASVNPGSPTGYLANANSSASP